MGRNKSNIPEQYRGIKRYSFSEIQSDGQCSWQYYLGRIKTPKEENKDNIYSLSGSIAHDVLEHEKDYEYDGLRMQKQFLNEFNEMASLGYKFSVDESKNEEMLNKYKNNILHYFKYYYKEDIEEEEIEYRIWTYVQDKLISGFVDNKYRDGEYFVIKDYKTSTMYSKADQEKGRNQLIIYAKDLIDKGIPIGKIKLCWDFIKYCNIEYKLPKKIKIDIMEHEYDDLITRGIIKTRRSKTREIIEIQNSTTTAERTQVGVKFKSSLRKILTYEELNEDVIESILSNLEKTNSMDNIPKDIVDKYEIKFKKCIVYADFNEEVLKRVEEELYEKICIIEKKLKSDNYDVWERNPVQDSDSFYCSKLCGVNHVCKYYKEYIENKEMFITPEHQTKVNQFRGGNDLNDISFEELLNIDNDPLSNISVDSLDDIDLSDLI